MPLRALVEGRAVQVWDLTREEWASLRCRGRAGAAAVVMACCGAPGLAKTSRNGNPFFAHRGRRDAGAAACRWVGECTAHALGKLLAAAGARRAGWEVRTEAAAPDGAWRGDGPCMAGEGRAGGHEDSALTAPPEALAQLEKGAAGRGGGPGVLPPAGTAPAPAALPAAPV